MNSYKWNEMALRERLALIGAIQVAPSGRLYWVFLFGSDILGLGVSKIIYGYKM